MSTIYFLKGLPASGKSTRAREIVATENAIRVNKDILREMLHNGVYSLENEALVCQVRDRIIGIALAEGFDVVVDDTNLNPEHQLAVLKVATAYDARVEVVFIDTPVEVCIERDAKRENPVGAAVIRRLYEKWLAKPEKQGEKPLSDN